jgi:hypothetical protein
MKFQKIMDNMVCWSTTHIQMYRYFIHRYATILLHDCFNRCNALWCHHSVCLTGSRTVCYRTTAVHKHLIPLTHLQQWQTCITALNCHSSMNFDGVSPFHYTVLLRCVLQAGRPFLPYYCAVMLHSCIILPPVSHSPNHKVSLLPTYQAIELCFEFLYHF